jgi:DNA-binding NtrC family response regulator
MALHPDEIRTQPGEDRERAEPTSTVRLEQGRLLKIRRFALRVIRGPHSGEERTFDQDRVRIGNDPKADLALQKDGAISRSHFEIVFTEKGWLLSDLQSTNGTFVDGRRVERAYLGVESELRAGQSELAFRALEDVTELAPDTEGRLGELVAESSAMRLVFAAARKVAPLGLPVLIEGEPGSGRRAIAHEIHRLSGRTGALIEVDAEDPLEPAEEALFGPEGAFVRGKGGTVVVANVELLSAPGQAKLVRAIEKDASTRVIATAADALGTRVREGGFKNELYFRLAVLTLEVPPLRRRPEDVAPILAGALAGKAVADDALEPLRRYGWPGNVRELLNVAAQLRTAGATIGKGDLPARVQGLAPEPRLPFNDHLSFHEAKGQLIEQFERAYLKELLERCGGNISEAARQSGLHRKSVERLVKKYQLTTREQ